MNPLHVTFTSRRQFLRFFASSLALSSLPRLRAADRSAPEDSADKPLPVADEPSHRKVFENAVLRVLDVQLAPGATSLFHWHTAPSVIVYLTKSTNRSETWPKREIITREMAPGESRYAPYDEKPLAHRVTNTGAGLFRVFDIELLHRPTTSTPLPPLPSAPVNLHWEERLARSSGITLAAGEQVVFPANDAALLLVVTAGSLGAKAGDSRSPSRHRWGEFRFFPQKTRLELHATGPDRAGALLLEVKT